MAAVNQVTDYATEGDIAIVTLSSPPVNALSAAARGGIIEAMAAATLDPGIRAILLICAGRTFIAGADISEFGTDKNLVESFRALMTALESSEKPVIAAIHGTALGGGLETALACHYRLATEHAKFGLPEVKLGLLPGAGGTQRLPRIAGVPLALDMVTSGRMIDAAAARAAGIVDDFIPEAEMRAAAMAYAHRLAGTAAKPKRIRDLPCRAEASVFAQFRKENAARFRGFEAPEFSIRCIEAATTKSFDDGLALETRLFHDLLNGVQSKAQRHLFFAERDAGKIPGLGKDITARPVAKIGIVGAGTMGSGIAMCFLNAGLPVTLVETKEDALDRGTATIRGTYEAAVKKGKLSAEQLEHNMTLLTPSLQLQNLADCDLVIEAVFEDMAIKRDVFAKLDAIVKPGALLASNTSFLDIDKLAQMTRRPGDVLGLHFFSPANIMRLVEVVRGAQTAPDVLATALHIAKKIGKTAVVSGVCHGFIGNRMLEPYLREANKLILEGAMPWDVDRVLYEFGFPMGPFQLSDLAGLDLGWDKQKSKGITLRDQLCEKNRRGQKTSAGFYDYDAARAPKPSKLVEELILKSSQKAKITRRKIADDEILQRCLYPLINEGAAILAEGHAYRASDIDIVWRDGYGFPAYRGGPMFYADTVGLKEIVAKLEVFAKTAPMDFKISPKLKKLADEGKSFCEPAV
jgi:3-hydroxyacyl-CoA dehydrogenase